MPPPRPILLVDILGTLVVDPFDVAVPRFFQLDMPELLRQKHPRAWVEFELGERTESEFLADFFSDGRAVDGAGLRAAMERTYAFLPGIEALLSDLVRRGYELHALSNYPVWYRWIEARLGLSRYLCWSFVSCEVGLRKPDPRLYRHVLETLGTSPRELLFVDDREENCRAAQDQGITALRFRGARELRLDLTKHGLFGQEPPGAG